MQLQPCNYIFIAAIYDTFTAPEFPVNNSKTYVEINSINILIYI